MEICCSVLTAERPISTLAKSIGSAIQNEITGRVSEDPPPIGTIDHEPIRRYLTAGHDGRYGNFQGWIRAARLSLALEVDLKEIVGVDKSPHEAIIMMEDDAILAPNVLPLLKRDLWPSADCGCVSLYCPAMTHYSASQAGLHKARIKLPDRPGRVATNNLVGALALVFPRHVLEELAYHPSIKTWPGSHAQAENPDTKSWERKAVDTWIGRTLLSMGKTVWNYYPSLVQHYEPDPTKSNSSLGHGRSRNARSAYRWVGPEPKDLLSMFKPPKERHEFAYLPENPK